MQEREASIAIPPRVARVNGVRGYKTDSAGHLLPQVPPERVERDSIGRVDSDPNESDLNPSRVTRRSRSRKLTCDLSLNIVTPISASL
ncbi:hypothetical protein [Oxynema sp. CENA135]|uniref:hypothetical protein n=1 Tax=Oxynema sp. CENA135 TaxID=984206 RepID=UPI00190CB7CB|nr:hypothetical protein [Oxynema sp. CENA135]